MTSQLTKVLHYLLLDPIERRSSTLLMFRLSQLLSERAKGRCDAPLARLLAGMKPAVTLPPSDFMGEAAMAASVASLHCRGWDILPWRLPPDDIASFRRLAFSAPAYADNRAEPIAIDERDPPRDHGRYSWRLSDLMRSPALHRLVADSALHRIAQDYLGGRPLLANIALMLDPVYQGEFDPHIYHYDIDGPKFLKYFIYLTDVDADSGAHTYIEGSHGHRKPAGLQRAVRYDRELLLSHYGRSSEIVFEAPAGTILAEDTAGFHKGSTLRKGYRLMLQLQYVLLDIPIEEELAAPIAKIPIGGLDPRLRRILGKFFI